MTQNPGPREVDPAEACEALQRAGVGLPAGGHDRRVFAGMLTGLGLLLGAITAANVYLDGGEVWFVGAGVLTWVAILVGNELSAWQKLTTRSVPRGANRIGWIGSAASVVVVLATAWLLPHHRVVGTYSWWVCALLGLAAALPLVVAGLAVARRRPAP